MAGIVSNTPTTQAGAIKQAVTDPTKAVVMKEEKVFFQRELTEDERNNQENKNENQNQNSTQAVPFNRQNKTQVGENRLAKLFEDLSDVEEVEGEMFYAIVTRRADMMGDRFSNPSLNNIQLPPLQIHSGMMLQFVDVLLRANGNSGGRFDIVITDAGGQQVEDVGVMGLCFANPLVEEKPAQQANGMGDLMEFMKFQAEQNRLDREAMLAATRPKEDEFMSLVREKMRNDFLNPPKREDNDFNIEKTMGRIMETQAVMGAMGEGFAKMFNRDGGSEKDEGLLKFLLSNDTFMEKAQDTIETLTNAATTIITSRSGAPIQQPQQPPTVNPNPNGSTYPPIDAGQPEEVIINENEQEIMDRTEIVKQLLDELESDRPLDASNEVLAGLKEKNQVMYDTLLQACKMATFPDLVTALKMMVPEEIKVFYNEDGTLSERGNYGMKRLEEFHAYMRTL